MPPIDKAGRQIAGLLGYNPGPGIYSRLERAIQDMPANVRVQELPGLLKRYKEGVPGWELKATDLDSTIAGRDVVPRDDLLAAVRERSPVYTHGEIVLGGTPQQRVVVERFERPDESPITTVTPEYGGVGKLGQGQPAGLPKYQGYGQGGSDYTELLLTQPGLIDGEYGNHWEGIAAPSPATRVAAADRAVAHARFDTHGDALRINELQSDLGIHNRKAREYADNNPQIQFGQRLNPPEAAGLPFPMEDAWAELLIKRLALEAARKGHRAIEVASPRAIADKVGGNIDNYEHFYGKVVPGAIERLGRKMGGLTAETPLSPLAVSPVDGLKSEFLDIAREISNEVPARARDYFDTLVNDMRLGNTAWTNQRAEQVAQAVAAAGITDPGAMPRIMSLAHRRANALDAGMSAQDAIAQRPSRTAPPGRRYIMSDEMRRRLIEQGVGASLLATLLMQEE